MALSSPIQAPVLRDTVLILEQPGEGDLDIVTATCQDPVFERYLTTPWPYERSHAETFVLQVVPAGWEEGTTATWAIRLQDDPEQLIGMIGLGRNDSPSIGYWLTASSRGRGIVPAAVRLVIDWVATSRWCPPELITWEAIEGNASSARSARKAGFAYTHTGPATASYRDGSQPVSWHGRFQPDPTLKEHAWTSWDEILDTSGR